MPLQDVNVWEALFEHTPAPIRWALTVLSLGVFALAGMLWRWNRADLARVERKIEEVRDAHGDRIRDLHERVDRSNTEVTQRLDEVNAHLLDIARNTNRHRSTE